MSITQTAAHSQGQITDAPASAHRRFRDQAKFSALDGLRCISIVAVVWHHSAADLFNQDVSSRGFLGVDLFFVISGFLIVTLLLREKSTSGEFSRSRFYMRRFLRIFPLYYGMVLSLAALYFYLGDRSETGQQFLSDLVIYLTYTGNFFILGWGIVWSLAAEEQFYTVWPQVEHYFSHLIFPILVAAIGINQLFNFPATREMIGSAIGVPNISSYSIVQATFTPILLGVVTAHAMHSRLHFDRLATLLCHRFASAGWLGLTVVLASIPNPDISGLHRLAIHVAMTGLVASCVATEHHWLAKALTLRGVARIGVVSYGIYLFHVHGILLATKLLASAGMHHALAAFGGGLLISYLFAEASFRYFESRFLRLKTKYPALGQKPSERPSA